MSKEEERLLVENVKLQEDIRAFRTTLACIDNAILRLKDELGFLKMDIEELKTRLPEQEPPSNAPVEPDPRFEPDIGSFERALMRMRQGFTVRRRGWPLWHVSVWLDQTLSSPRFVTGNQDSRVSWLPNLQDLLATDWEVVE
jgi:hypothetical protein